MQSQDVDPSRAAQSKLRGNSPSSRSAGSAWRHSFSSKPFAASFFSIFVLSLLLASPRADFASDSSYYHLREIKPNVFVWIAEDILDQEGDPEFNRAGNAGFIITRDGVVVVNTTNTPFNARALLYEIRQRTELPIRYVINTSASPDVMLGNEAFEDFKPVIISTRPAALAMRQYRDEFPARIEGNWRVAASMRGVHPVPSNQIFDKELTLHLGGQQIKVIDLGDNASPGDAAVYLPGSKVLFLGNVFENEYVPRMGSADIDHWIATLEKVESWDVDVFVPGHGEPSGKAGVHEFRSFLEWLSGQVQLGLKKGMTLPQIQNALVPFQKLHWHAPELESEAVGAVYRLLVKQKNQASSSAESTKP
jgi:cyclase